MKKLVCEICGEVIAKVGDVDKPLQGSMFQCLADHLPSPFPITQQWIDMRCPYCRYRPFTEEDKILTEDGFIELGKPGIKEPYGANFVSGGVMKGLPKIVQISPDTFGSPIQNVVSDLGSIGGSIVEEELLPEADGSGDTNVPEQPEMAKGSEADHQGRTFDDLVESGEVKQHGSWYEYDGKNYRKNDLIDYLEGK